MRSSPTTRRRRAPHARASRITMNGPPIKKQAVAADPSLRLIGFLLATQAIANHAANTQQKHQKSILCKVLPLDRSKTTPSTGRGVECPRCSIGVQKPYAHWPTDAQVHGVKFSRTNAPRNLG